MNQKKENNSDDKLFSLLRVSRPETFWIRQKNNILAKIQSPKRSHAPVRWLVPAFATALVLTLLILQQKKSYPPTHIPITQDWAFLEKLDLWENWEVIENLNEKSL
ncbi:MAG: hypothetical protein HY399_02495 [Elusimicrobia bacterium]|nr:hypothetical protein [Elusimicrobiota bacterium]